MPRAVRCASRYEYMTRMSRQLTPATRISFGWIYIAMPAGFALFLVHLLLVVRGYLRAGTFEKRQEGAEPVRPAG